MSGSTPANPLPPSVVRNLSDKLYDRRKAAALEVERLVTTAAPETLAAIVDRLVDYTRSANTNARKGGLLCLAATAVGLAAAGEAAAAAGAAAATSTSGTATPTGDKPSAPPPAALVVAPAGLPEPLLGHLLAPVLDALRDPDARTRFYALEALYNIIRAARGSPALAPRFPEVLSALFSIYGDSSPDVQNAAAVLDNLLKDVAAESVHSLAWGQVVPLLTQWLQAASVVKQSFVLGWLTFLETLPDQQLLLDHLPGLMPGLLTLISAEQPEIRQSVNHLLQEFLLEVQSERVDVTQLAGILVSILSSGGPGASAGAAPSAAEQPPPQPTTLLTCLKWLDDLLDLAPAALLPQAAEVLQAVLPQRGSDSPGIASAASQLLAALRRQLAQSAAAAASEATAGGPGAMAGSPDSASSQLHRSLLAVVGAQLEEEGEGGEAVKLEALQLLQELLRRDARLLTTADAALLSALYETLQSSMSDRVVAEALDVLCSVAGGSGPQFAAVLRGLLDAFRGGPGARLLQRRGMAIVQHFCDALGAERVLTQLSEQLAAESESGDATFAISLIQALNLCLLTAGGSLAGLRRALRNRDERLFSALWQSWAGSAAAALSIALLAEEDELAWGVVRALSGTEPSLATTLELTQLVQLLESPAFAGVRMRLLEPPAAKAHLRRAIAGVAMLLPHGDALRTMSIRLSVAGSALGIVAGDGLAAAAAPRSTGTIGGSSGSSDPALTRQRLELFLRQQDGR